MSKDTIAKDWTARVLRFNADTPTGKAALSIQLSSVTAGAVFEFHLSGAASGDVPSTFDIDLDCDRSNVTHPFAASSIPGAKGRATFDSDGMFLLMGDKKGRVPFDCTLSANFGHEFVVAGIFLLKSVTHFKSSASTSTTIQFTDPPKQPLSNDIRPLN